MHPFLNYSHFLMITRRTLLRSSAGTLAGAMLTRPRTAQAYAPMHGAVSAFQELPHAGDERLKMLIATAVDAAKSSGATYADARLTFSQKLSMEGQNLSSDTDLRKSWPELRSETMAFGVRAQYDGYWGFASSPVWTKDEAARLGRVAVDSAKANVSGRSRDIEMASNPGAKSGDWTMPVTDDPFAMDTEEIWDYLSGIKKYMDTLGNEMEHGRYQYMNMVVHFFRQQKAFGSSDGRVVTQRVYRTGGNLGWTVADRDGESIGMAAGALTQFTTAGAGRGFELIRTPDTRKWMRQLWEELDAERRLPVVPVDVGRFPVLIHSGGVADILKKSVGIATEIDRIMGYEANTTGTSYIIDPDESLGSLKIGSSLMRVTATRSMPGGLAQVKWDDEGVEPQDVDLITNGVLTNLQCNREGTAWMKGYLTKAGRPVRSNGCAYALDATDPQTVYPSDLILHPDSERDTTLTQLREQIDKGIEFKTSGAMMDFQQSTGMLGGASVFLIEKGKRVARIDGAGMLFRTSELWGNLQALGGPSSAIPVGTADPKTNNFWKLGFSTVNTPPALFKEMSIINPFQKA